VIAFSSEASDGPVKYLIDSNLNTIWHSQFTPTSAPFPHWAIIDLGDSRDIVRIEITRRKNTSYVDTKTVQCYVGDDFSYVNPTDGNKNIGKVTFSKTVGDDVKVLDVVPGTDTNGRYLLLYLPDNNGRDTFVSLAEISVYTNADLTITPRTQTVAGEANSSAEYAISTIYTGWSASTTADWVDLSVDQEHNILKATAKTANPESIERKAVITVASGTIQSTINFVQSPNYQASILIPSIEEKIQCRIFPNPVKDRLNIVSDHPIKEMALIDLWGKTVLNIYRENIGSQYQLDLSSLDQGTYLLRVNINNQIHTKKIIKWERNI
jgi:hypothetical protein